MPKKTGRPPQRDEPPCEIGIVRAGIRQEEVPSRNSGTTHERHDQAEHDPSCESDTKNTSRLEGVPPCSSCTTQEKCLQEGEPYSGSWLIPEEATGRCRQENDPCANVTQRKRLRLQGDQLESRTSTHKDASERAQEELERWRMTEEFVMKGKGVERLKIERDTIRRLRKQLEACASALADVLRGIATNTSVKNWTLWGVDPLQNEKRENARM